MRSGGLPKDSTTARTGAGVEKPARLTPRTARALRDEKKEIIPAERARVDEILQVLPYRNIPSDDASITDSESENAAEPSATDNQIERHTAVNENAVDENKTDENATVPGIYDLPSWDDGEITGRLRSTSFKRA